MKTGMLVPAVRDSVMTEVDLLDLSETELALYFRALPKSALETVAMNLSNLVRGMQPSTLNDADTFLALTAMDQLEKTE